MPSSVLDENVDVCLVRQYFSHDAWEVVEQVVSLKKVYTITLHLRDTGSVGVPIDNQYG